MRSRPTAAAAETVKARYSVSLVGLHIGEIGSEGWIEPANYKIDLNAHLTGVASWIAHVKMALASSGLIRGGTVLPTAYATTSANSADGPDAAHVASSRHGAGRRHLAAVRRFRGPRSGHGRQ